MGERSTAEPLAARKRLKMMPIQGLLLSVILASCATISNAVNICNCQCCYSGICLDRPNNALWNGTFQVTGCSACTKSLCSEVFKAPYFGACEEVSANCVDYDTYWHLVVILLIIITVAVLLLLGILRDLGIISPTLWKVAG